MKQTVCDIPSCGKAFTPIGAGNNLVSIDVPVALRDRAVKATLIIFDPVTPHFDVCPDCIKALIKEALA